MPVFRRGQEIVVQRCSDIASRHLYGQALTIAAANCRADLCETLLEENLEYSLEELTCVLNSISVWASAEVVQSFLKHDARKVLGIQQYSSGLSHAARKNNTRAVVYWLEKHPEHDNFAVDPATVIDVSANGFLGVLIPLMNHIRRQDSFERTLSQCLQAASNNGHDEVVEYLIVKGADVNTVIDIGEDLIHDRLSISETRYGSTRKLSALHPALIGYDRTRYGSTRKLSALHAALIGFDRFSDNEGYDNEQTRAAVSSQQRTIKLLLEKGTDLNGINGYGRYLLEIAATNCTVKIV